MLVMNNENPKRDTSFWRLKLVRRSTWLTVSVLVVALSSYTAWHVLNATPQIRVKQGEEKALIKSKFELVDHRGNKVTEQKFKGQWQLVFFGFTFCPDVCPTTLASMAEVLEALGKDIDQVAALFITVDPERDTEAIVAEYVAAFHPKLIGLTGTSEQVKAAAKSFRVYYAKVEKTDVPDGYLMAHSGYIYLMTPDGEYEAVFTDKYHPPKKIVAEIKKRLKR